MADFPLDFPMTKARFRHLFVLYIFLSIAAFFADLWGAARYSNSLTEAYAQEPNASLENYPWQVLFGSAVLVSVALLGMVGLYRFKYWGRVVSLYTTIAGLILISLAGPTLTSPFASPFVEGASILWRALMAIAYTSPLSEEFSRSRPAAK